MYIRSTGFISRCQKNHSKQFVKQNLMSKIMALLLISIINYFILFADSFTQESAVTYGSCLKLQNVRYNVRLHSERDVNYGSGSVQQSVTGLSAEDDADSLWLVLKADGRAKRGDAVRCNDIIKLHHVSSGKYLHSHLIASPLSKQQEVSAFGDINTTDSGDEWMIECAGDAWRRDERIRLRHTDTDTYLSTSGMVYGRPIDGHMEVVTSATLRGPAIQWKPAEGVYFTAKLGIWETLKSTFHSEL